MPRAVGIDAVEVTRLRSVLERTPALIDRTFTANEIAYCRQHRDPAERFAARWAAKEAVVKCLGGGVPGLDLRGIEVVHAESGAPEVRLDGEAAARAREIGISGWLLSLTHTTILAEAIAIGLG